MSHGIAHSQGFPRKRVGLTRVAANHRQKELTMTGVRNTGFMVSLALLISLVGHVAIQRYFERRAQSMVHRNQVEPSTDDALFFSTGLDRSEISRLNMPRFMDSDDRQGRIIPVNDRQEEESQAKTQRSSNPPTAVPAPADALPVETSANDEKFAEDSETSAVRDVIEHELSHASREERDIWFEELKSLPAGVVADLLQVRKQLHALPKLLGGMPEKLVSADPTFSARTQDIAAEPASRKIRFNSQDDYPAAAALEVAALQLRHNLTNAATPGFKRLRVTLVDAYGCDWREANDSHSDTMTSSSVQGEGCRIAPLLLDLKQGLLKKTTRQLDLAIDGDGFFVVHRGDKEFLTRCGAFTLDRDRQLCLAVVNDRAVLQPAIKIPQNAREIQISAEGVVTVLKSSDAALIEIGQLKLAKVASAARLQPVGSTLFVANDDSGAIEFGEPMAEGLGEVHQGFLEQSNVDFEQELAEMEELFMILKVIPLQNPRPATARSLQNAPTR